MYMIALHQTVALQHIAHQLFNDSAEAKKLYQAQIKVLGDRTQGKLFELDFVHRRIYFLNRHFIIQFYSEYTDEIFKIHTDLNPKITQNIENFLFVELELYIDTSIASNSIRLREKVNILRQYIFDLVFDMFNANEQLEPILSTLSQQQAEHLDHLCIQAGCYKHTYLCDYVMYGHTLPEQVRHVFRRLCSVEFFLDSSEYSVQQLTQQLNELCCCLLNTMPTPLHRLCDVLFDQAFNLLDLHNQKDVIKQLWRHAQESPHLLSFIQFIDQEAWQNSDLFSKHHFYEQSSVWCKDQIQVPIFDHKKAVNWLFRQHVLVVDWICQYIQSSSVRASVVALSFIDCSAYHPNIIVSALQYFQYSAARIVVHACASSSGVIAWLSQQNLNEKLTEPSILYLDEWMQLIQRYSCGDVQKLKKIYLNLSRLMQAYMQYLQHKTQSLASELIDYIQPEKQQERHFYFLLQRHDIKLHEFRELFYLRERNIRESIFTPYVHDFLLDYLSQNITLSKHTTWLGLFHKAVRWHHQEQKEAVLFQLKTKYACITWSPFTHAPHHFLNWHFEELNNIERIVEESQIFQHCLAISYTEQIIARLYVAFHMWSEKLGIHLTLGCHIQHNVLVFDQLEYPNNQKAEQLLVNIALQFIEHMNECLYLKSHALSH